MPTLARFGKVKLRMSLLDRPPPHFRLAEPGFRVRLAIGTLGMIDGVRVPRAAVAGALAWAADHRDLLRATWREMTRG
jgi:Domain of unknown function (DUF4160)